jgi:hypothetical protein
MIILCLTYPGKKYSIGNFLEETLKELPHIP